MAQIVTFEDAKQIFADFAARYQLEVPQVIDEKGHLVAENPNIKLAARPDTFGKEKTNISFAIISARTNLQSYLNQFWIPVLNEILKRNGASLGSGKCAEHIFGRPLIEKLDLYHSSDSFFMGKFSSSGEMGLGQAIERVYISECQFLDLTKCIEDVIQSHLPGYMPNILKS